MACKDQCRFAVEPQLRKQFVGARLDLDPAILGARGIVLPDMIEMREFGADATEIVPDACENGLSAGDFSGNAAVRLARPILCSRIIGPIERAIRPNRSAVLIGSK